MNIHEYIYIYINLQRYGAERSPTEAQPDLRQGGTASPGAPFGKGHPEKKIAKNITPDLGHYIFAGP